jgi:hypothetical protein
MSPRLPWTSFLFWTCDARRRVVAAAVHCHSQNRVEAEAPNWAWFDTVGMDAPAWASTDGANADLKDIEGAPGTEAASYDESLLASCHESEMEETVCRPVARVPRRLALVQSRARLLDPQLDCLRSHLATPMAVQGTRRSFRLSSVLQVSRLLDRYCTVWSLGPFLGLDQAPAGLSRSGL